MKVSEERAPTFLVQEPRAGPVQEIIPNRVKYDANSTLPKFEKHLIYAQEFLDSVLGEVALRIERISMHPSNNRCVKPLAFQSFNGEKEKLKQQNISSLSHAKKRVHFSSPVISNVFEDSEDMASQDTVILDHDSEDDSISIDPNKNIIDFEMTSFCKRPNEYNVDKILEFSPDFNKVSKNHQHELIEKFQDRNAELKSSCSSSETKSVKQEKDNTSSVSLLDPNCFAEENIIPISNFSSRFQSLQKGFNALFVKKHLQKENNVSTEEPEKTQPEKIRSVNQQSAMSLKCLPNSTSSPAPFVMSTKQEEPHNSLKYWLEAQKNSLKVQAKIPSNSLSLAEQNVAKRATKQLQNSTGIQSKLQDSVKTLPSCMEHSSALAESKVQEENFEKFENENSKTVRANESCSDSVEHESDDLHCPVSKELTLLINNEPDNKDADEWYMRTMKRKFDMEENDIAVPIKCWCENENGNNGAYIEHETCSQHRHEYLLSEDQLVPGPDEAIHAHLKRLQSELPVDLSLEHNLVNHSEISNNQIEKINFSPISEMESQESIYAQNFRSQDSLLSQESIALKIDKVIKEDNTSDENYPNAEDFAVPLSGVKSKDRNFVVNQKPVHDQNENQRNLCIGERKCALHSDMNFEIPSADHRKETTINSIDPEAADCQKDYKYEEDIVNDVIVSVEETVDSDGRNMDEEIPSADNGNETTINSTNLDAADSRTDYKNQENIVNVTAPVEETAASDGINIADDMEVNTTRLVPSRAPSISLNEDKCNEDTAMLQVAPEAELVIENEDIDRSALDATVPTTPCESKRIPGSVVVNSEVEVGGKCDMSLKDNKGISLSLRCSGGAVDTPKHAHALASSFAPHFSARMPDFCKRIENWFIDDESPQSLAHSISYTPEDDYIDSSEGFEIDNNNLSGLSEFWKEKQWIRSADENVAGEDRKSNVLSKVEGGESYRSGQKDGKKCIGESLEADGTKRTEEDTSKFVARIESNEDVKKCIADADESCRLNVNGDEPSAKKLCLENVADPMNIFVAEARVRTDSQNHDVAEKLKPVKEECQNKVTEVQQRAANQHMENLNEKEYHHIQASKVCLNHATSDHCCQGNTEKRNGALEQNHGIEDREMQEVAVVAVVEDTKKLNKAVVHKKLPNKTEMQSRANGGWDTHVEDEQIVEAKVHLSAEETDTGFYQDNSSANKRLHTTPEQMNVSISKINQTPSKNLKSKEIHSPPPSCNRNSGAFNWSARRKLFSDKADEEVLQDDEISNHGMNNDQRVVPCLTPSPSTRASSRSDSTRSSGPNHSRGLRLGLSRRRTTNRLHPYWSAERIRSDRQIVPDLGIMQHENEE